MNENTSPERNSEPVAHSSSNEVKTISASSYDELEERVRAEMAKGFMPVGKVARDSFGVHQKVAFYDGIRLKTK